MCKVIISRKIINYIKPKLSESSMRWTNPKSLWELNGVMFDILLYIMYGKNISYCIGKDKLPRADDSSQLFMKAI